MDHPCCCLRPVQDDVPHGGVRLIRTASRVRSPLRTLDPGLPLRLLRRTDPGITCLRLELTGSSVTTMCGRCIIQAGIAPAPLLQLPGPNRCPPLVLATVLTRCARCGSDLSPVTAQAAPHDLPPSHTPMEAAGDLNGACVMPQTQGKSGRCFSCGVPPNPDFRKSTIITLCAPQVCDTRVSAAVQLSALCCSWVSG